MTKAAERDAGRRVCAVRAGCIHHFGCDRELYPPGRAQAACCACVAGMVTFPGTDQEERYDVSVEDEEHDDDRTNAL